MVKYNNGHLQMAGEVNDEMLATVERATRRKRVKTFSIITDGGSLSAAFGLYNILYPLRADAYVPAQCHSAGTIIALSGKKRICSPYSIFLIHFGEEAARSKGERRINQIQERWMASLYQERTGQKASTVCRWLSKETFLTAEEALDIGLVTEVKGHRVK